MKSFLLSLVLVTLLSQCTTNTDGTKTFDVNKAVMVVNISVPSAVRLGVSKEPKAAAYLKDLALVIDTFSSAEDLSPKAFLEAISSVSVGLKTPEALAVIDMVVALYESTYADVLVARLDEAKLIPFLQAISISIKKGLK